MDDEQRTQAEAALRDAGAGAYSEFLAPRLSVEELADGRKTRGAIERLRKSYPELFGPQDMNQIIRSQPKTTRRLPWERRA